MKNTKKPNTVHILTFESNKLPGHVKIGWRRLLVREFIARPRWCFKYQKWGHGFAKCRSDTPICLNCGQTFHGTECTGSPNFPNCAEAHTASSKSCAYLKIQEDAPVFKPVINLATGKVRRRLLRTMTLMLAFLKQRQRQVNNLHQSIPIPLLLLMIIVVCFLPPKKTAAAQRSNSKSNSIERLVSKTLGNKYSFKVLSDETGIDLSLPDI